MASPLHVEQQAEPHARIMGGLAVYMAATPGVRLADNATSRLDADNEFQPDALLRLPEHAGGKSRINRHQRVVEGLRPSVNRRSLACANERPARAA